MCNLMRGWIIGCFIGITNLAIAEGPDTLWTKTYGGTNDDKGYSMDECADGGFIITGMTWSFGAGKDDVYLVRTKANGDTLWTKTYGGTKNDWGRSVQECANGDFIIAGGTKSFGGTYLIRTDADGDTLWTKTYGGAGKSVQECANGDFIIAGTSNRDVYLVRTKANGDTLWTKTYGTTDNDMGEEVQECADGGFIIAGKIRSLSRPTKDDVYLIRTKANGDTLWTKIYGGTGDDWGESVQECADGGFVVTGVTYSFSALGDGDVYLIRTKANGDTLWTKTYGGIETDMGESVQKCADGGFIIAAQIRFAGGLIRTKANGDTLWTKTYGAYTGRSLKVCADGSFVIAGHTGAFGAGKSDVYLIKTSAAGVEEHKSQVTSHKLQVEVYPNPSTTVVRVQWLGVSAGQKVSLKVYDLGGRLVKRLLNNEVISGNKIEVNLEEFVRGIYFVKMEAGSFKATRKLTILR